MSLAVGFTLLSLLLNGVSDVIFKKYSVIFLFEFGLIWTLFKWCIAQFEGNSLEF
jgi:hypothetical protein